MPENECPSPPSGARFTQRKAPFGRKSISQMASGTPLGSHHCVTCSALVQASKTTARGASKSRVTTIWRSLGVVIVTGPMLFTGPFCPSTCFLLLLHFFQVPVQTGEFLLPKAAKRVNPVGDVLERDSHECARTPLCIVLAHNEARAFEDAEVLGDGRLTQVERLHELRNICVTGSKARKDSTPRGVCERCEDQAQAVSLYVNRHTAIFPYGDIQVKKFRRLRGRLSRACFFDVSHAASARCRSNRCVTIFVSDLGMSLSVNLQTVQPRKLAAVRCEVALGSIGSAWGPA